MRSKILAACFALLVSSVAHAQWTWTWDVGDRIVGGPYFSSWYDSGTKTSPGAISQGDWSSAALARNSMQQFTNSNLEVYSDSTESGKAIRSGQTQEITFNLSNQPYERWRPFVVLNMDDGGSTVDQNEYDIERVSGQWRVLFTDNSGVGNRTNVQVNYSYISGNARWIRLSSNQISVRHSGDELAFKEDRYQSALQENRARDEFGGDGCLVCLATFQEEPVNYHTSACWIGVDGEDLGHLDP